KADADDPGRQAGGLGLDERVVDEDKARRALLKAFRGGERGGRLRRGRCLRRRVIGKLELLGIRVAPVFILESRQRQGLEFGPRGRGAVQEPFGGVESAGGGGGEQTGGGS